jgi:hypothetical protein
VVEAREAADDRRAAREKEFQDEEDNHAVCYVLAGMTSRSPAMMSELRRL